MLSESRADDSEARKFSLEMNFLYYQFEVTREFGKELRGPNSVVRLKQRKKSPPIGRLSKEF
jgi:hypothetical protein